MKGRIVGTLGAMALSLVLAGCGGPSASAPVTVTVKPAPLDMAVRAEGSLKAVHSTSLNVPGKMWSNRQLAWALPDGSRVQKGQVVARFSATQSKQDLAIAVIDLALNQLARDGKQSDLIQQHGKLRVNLAQVASQLSIANRYANASVLAIARNKILDAVQNRHYLTTKQGVLEWRQGESSKRGKAELAVIGAKRATLALQAEQKRNDLNALQLRAPHAGILMLQANWQGQKPQVGASFTAGRPFANLPDLAHMEVLLQVPQIESQGIQEGLKVKLHPLGNPRQTVVSKITWVAGAAAPISRENPVKYLAIKVSVPAEAETRFSWVPGMRFAGEIVLLHAKSALSVPNLALDTRGDGVTVRVAEGGKVIQRAVKLGVQGPARSQVLSGLKAGDRVLLERRTQASKAGNDRAATDGQGAVS